MIDINWTPSDRQLRQFAVAFLVFAGFVGGVLWWRLGDNTASLVLWVLAPLVAGVGLIAPRAIRWLFIGLTLAAFPIGMVVGFVMLAITYYLVVTPIALFFRLIGRDPLHRVVEPEKTTYWIRRPPKRAARRYFQQF